ncbi:hypothetical protein NQ317_017958 [Molorchus minor]|uniref:Pentatricopeptide repeat-containing protein n=1 Tax=Molorchus minor TaxID=1323400 RepID=A0ABQ9JLL7_9CUCU|nr:hypothetical protein NQ317_017958 [Molorchus minor]
MKGQRKYYCPWKIKKYRPNLMTYGILALGCKTKAEGLDLITEMKEKSYTLNAEILGAMLHQACYHNNFNYVVEIMEICLRENVQPNKKFMEHLANFRKKMQKVVK